MRRRMEWLPLTVMRYTLRNTSNNNIEVSIAGVLANPILIHSGSGAGIDLLNRIVKLKAATCLHCTAKKAQVTEVANACPEIVFDDFEAEAYNGWTVEGTAFGAGPVVAAQMPAYQGQVNAKGEMAVG